MDYHENLWDVFLAECFSLKNPYVCYSNVSFFVVVDMQWLHEAGLLVMLVVLECVLSIDNIIMISVKTQSLAEHDKVRARRLALTIAFAMRLVFAFFALQLLQLTMPLSNYLSVELPGLLALLSVKDGILLAGGLFLIHSSVMEIHRFVEANNKQTLIMPRDVISGLLSIVLQLVLLDMVFSLDSILTALAFTQRLWLIVSAVCASFVFVAFAAGPIIEIISRQPSLKILALAFLFAVGVSLFMEGLHQEIAKETLYVPLGFALCIEFLKIRRERNTASTKKSTNMLD